MRDITLFLINGLLFMLVGLQLHPILVGLSGEISPATLIGMAAAICLTVILVRVLWMFPAVYVPYVLSRWRRMREAIPNWRYVAIAGWTGLRGGVSLAAALAVPLAVSSGAPFPNRQLILFLTFAVILATLVFQGLTLQPLIRWLGISSEGKDREETLARLKSTRAANAALERLATQPWTDPEVVADLRGHLRKAGTHHQRVQDNTLTPEQKKKAEAAKRLNRELNDAQSREIARLVNEGAISGDTARTIQHELDLEALRYS
jgi:CPA1 family monovalent cation:H+ antiporter